MKKQFPRELFWMTLPVLLLGGTALWINKTKSPIVSISRAFTNATRPVLSVEEVSGVWRPPVVAAVEGKEESCMVRAVIGTPNAWLKTNSANGPHFTMTDVVDETGRSLNSLYGKSRFLPSGTMSGILPLINGTLPSGYEISALVPLAALPPTRSTTFIGTVGWGTAKPIAVKFQVIPPWMSRSAKRLHIERVVWRPYPTNHGSEVEVICRLSKPTSPSVYYSSVDQPYWPELQGGVGSARDSDTILANWSQRIESGDGRLNSLDLLQRHMNKDSSAFFALKTKNYSQAASLDSFDPLCQVDYSNIKKDQIRLIYSISGVPQFFKHPIFRCDIYLVGDGKVSVRCPLISKSIDKDTKLDSQ